LEAGLESRQAAQGVDRQGDRVVKASQVFLGASSVSCTVDSYIGNIYTAVAADAAFATVVFILLLLHSL
jgi:hypothetical protein